MKISTKKAISTFFSVTLIICILTISASALVRPRASLVFGTIDNNVTAGQYWVSAALVGKGSVSISMTLQKQSGSAWIEKDSDSGSYTDVAIKKLSKSYTITESGTYRCSYTITATVNGTTETKTGYSATFTK